MPSAKQMDVEVVDGLAAVGAGVNDQPVAISQVLLTRDFSCCRDQMPEHGCILRRCVGKRGDVLLRDEQDMYRCLRVDVREGEDMVVLIDALGGDGAGDDFAEETIHRQ